MLSFTSDYNRGAHPEILRRLPELNQAPFQGYGGDDFCRRAGELIRTALGDGEADVCFLTGGTQTNQAVISALLYRNEAVLAPETGHINVHEAGAIEYTGHKVIALPSHQGRISAADIEEHMERFYADETHEHMCFPGLVYISHPTELGTLYSKAELQAISAVCRRYELRLFLDGARLGCGLMSPETDLSLGDINEYCDAFYIGGTKMGALCGEALVFPRRGLPRRFATLTKQQGAMLAKGALLGLQFETLFTDGLYFKIGEHSVKMALKLKAALLEKGCELYIDSPTNQQFFVLSRGQLEKLSGKAEFSTWEKLSPDRSAVRFVCSWATRAEEIKALASLL